MKKSLFTLLLISLCSPLFFSQNINGRFSSSLYAFQRFDTTDVSGKYLRSFQMLNLNVNEGHFSLRSYLNLEADLSKSLQNDPRLRFYNLYFEGRNLFDILSFKLGRQPIFSGIAGGTFDGLNVDLKKSGYKLSAYYGGNVPAYQKLKVTDDFKNDFIVGGKLTAVSVKDFQFVLGYVNKNFKAQDYMALRYDANLNPMQVLIQNESTQYQYASAEVNYEMKSTFSVNTKYDYDINFEKTSKFEAYGSYDQLKDFRLNIYYNFREPRIKYNSIFSVFDYGNSQEVEVGADYNLTKTFTLIGKFGNVTYKNDNSQRITLGVNSNYGSINYRKTLGYEGELDALSLYSAYSFIEGLLTPSAGISYTSYKLSKDDDTNHLVAILGGLNFRPLVFLSFDCQAQYMNNKIYKDDFRFFFKLNYWFNTNIN